MNRRRFLRTLGLTAAAVPVLLATGLTESHAAPVVAEAPVFESLLTSRALIEQYAEMYKDGLGSWTECCKVGVGDETSRDPRLGLWVGGRLERVSA